LGIRYGRWRGARCGGYWVIVRFGGRDFCNTWAWFGVRTVWMLVFGWRSVDELRSAERGRTSDDVNQYLRCEYR